MSPLSQSLLPILFVLMTIEGSTAGILDNLGLNLLNRFPFTSNDVNDGSASEQWPSFVKIVDAADLPSLLYASMNVTSHNSSGSAWSNLLNIFGSGDSISDEMERENGAWFAIPGWNKAMVNGTGLAHTILPGLIVPAKLEPHQMYDVANRLNPLFNNFSKTFPLGFLFNHGQNINLNPFNLPFLPELNEKPTEDLKSEPEAPQKIQSTLETADIKPSSENKENVVETPNLKDAPKIRAIRSIFQRFLNVANDENAEIKDGDKIVNVVEPVKETGVQMEPIPTTESNPETNSEPQKPNSEDTRTLGALGLLGPLLNLFSGSLGGSPINTLTNDLQSLGTLRPPSSSSSSSSSSLSYNGQNGFNLNGQNVPNPFFGNH